MNEPNNKVAQLLKASRRRRTARGVAMVEGALVFPIMAGFMVMLEMAHHGFDAYITAEHVSEERTWSAATKGAFLQCSGGRDDVNYKPGYFTKRSALGGSSDNAGATPAADKSKTEGNNVPGPGGFFIYHDSAQITFKASRGTGSLNETFEKPATARSKVFCNQPWMGGLIDIIKNAFSSGKSKS